MFDSQVFRPDSPPNLEPNTRYTIKIESIEPVAKGNAWDVLKTMAGTVEAHSDWSSQHDCYLYGTPKHTTEDTE